MFKAHKSICFVVSVEFAVNAFLLNHLRLLAQVYDITLVTNTKNPNFLKEQGLEIKVVSMPIVRPIHPLKDLLALIKLYVYFKKNRFDAVHSLTPKAGFLSMMATWMCCIPLRVHTFTGQVWCNKSGAFARVLMLIDKMTAMFATHLIVDSPTQRDFLIDRHVIEFSKAYLLGKGSVSGVDLEKFKLNPKTRTLIRNRLSIPSDSFLFIFVGRITQEKGVLDLADAFVRLNHPDAYLLIVGPDEEDLLEKIKYRLGTLASQLRVVGYTREVESYLATADVLCLPSYREGFGSSVIEAAAMGIPAIASDIYGLRDAVEDGVTGLLHPPHDIVMINHHMQSLMQDINLYKRLSAQAIKRTKKYFDQKDLTQMWLNFYRDRMLDLPDK